jgi:hypothetical protein
LLLTLPALAVRYPPITDLPQQMAQIPLLVETLSGDAPAYRVQWLAPNKLSYFVLGATWAALPPMSAIKLATALFAVLWLAPLQWLAARRGRSGAAALIAAVFFFNHFLYVGFLNFLCGVAAFVFWFVELESDPDGVSWLRTVLRTAVGAFLLYLAHALWLAAGLAWLALVTLTRRPSWRAASARAVGLLPALALTALWYPTLKQQGWQSMSNYGPSALERLSPAGLTNWSLGGVRGALEPLTLLAIALWIGVALWQHRRRLAARVDTRLLAAALFFFVAAVALPEKVDKTLQFASRWMPVAWGMLLLALPAPDLRPALRRGVALGLLAAFTLTTASAWRAFDRHELTGFEEAIAALPAEPAVLGLDFVRGSPRFKYPTYMQLPAYAQLLRGGHLNFSFVSLASSLVVKKEISRPDPWTQGLEWAPRLLRMSDLEYFDHALVHAPDEVQELLRERDPRLEPVTATGRWRLFRIDNEPTPETEREAGT